MYEAKDVGAFIARMRAERGWTQRQLAERLHVTDKAVSRWERGTGYPDISIIPALASALGVTETELLRGARGADTQAEDINGAIRGTLSYVRRAQVDVGRRLRVRAFAGGTLALLYAATLSRKADLYLLGHVTWSFYVAIGAVFLWLLLAVACLSRTKAFLKTLCAGCVGIFPALYIALWRAGLAQAFLPTAVPVALFSVALIGAIALMMSLDFTPNVLSGVLAGALLVAIDVLSGLLLSWLHGEAVRGLISREILLLAGFILVLAILPWPDGLKRRHEL